MFNQFDNSNFLKPDSKEQLSLF